MRILVRDRHTVLYYAGPYNWTAAQVGAHLFESIDAALRVCNSEMLYEAEILLVSDVVPFSAPIPVLLRNQRYPLPVADARQALP